MYHEMKIFGFAIDPIAQMPIVILKDASGEHSVPIWISNAESFAFAAELIGREISSHSGRKDLFEHLLERMGMRIERIMVEGLQDGVFQASLSFVGGAEEINLSVRVSEAMTMALKCRLPVMVSDEVLKQASSVDMSDDCFVKENNARRFVDFLENLDPSAMGKYPM